jgi:DNA-binding MltR family transcriptional regulator
MKKTTINDIVKQMENEEYSELNWDFIFKLSNESDRGAILIGASKVEEHLLNLVLIILPKSTKSYTNYLIKYPGPISSFSGKIELLYAFRIIDEEFYTSLNQLRSIRNKAAHTSEEFSLKELNTELKKVNNFENLAQELIDFISWNSLIKFKRSTVKEMLDKQNVDRKTYKELW